MDLTPAEEAQLLTDIATRAFTSYQLCVRWDTTADELKTFVDANRPRLEAARKRFAEGEPTVNDADVTPEQLDTLWISKKAERLKRYQELAEVLYADAMSGNLSGADLSTAVREYRSYCTVVANELGQLMHRGSGEGAGDGATVNYSITGIDMDTLR